MAPIRGSIHIATFRSSCTYYPWSLTLLPMAMLQKLHFQTSFHSPTLLQCSNLTKKKRWETTSFRFWLILSNSRKRTQEMSCVPSVFSLLLRLFTEWGHYFPTEPKNKTTREHYISSYLSCQKKKALSFDNPSNGMGFVSKELSLEQKEDMRNTNKT